MRFLDQELFTSLLSLERKRCERTGHAFGLALLDLSDSPVVLPLCNALATQMRETDLCGWYRQELVAGVIFTLLDGSSTEKIRSKLMEKVNSTMESVLSPEDRKKIKVILRIFPEDIYEEFYPDLPQLNQKKIFHNTKRFFDVTASLSALFMLSPIMITIAIIIKLTSKGPVLFKQTRLGMFKKEFQFLKFRSMYANNDSSIHEEYVSNLIQNKVASSGVYKIEKDPRITPIGHFLRKTSLDELPQFWNVLRGDMSLVGPRPPIPYEMEKYYPWHRRRVFEVKPGITGLWQVYGRSRTTFDQMVRMDIQYIREQSPLLDAKILLKTPFAMFSGKGAY
ncbi:MAG: sugar transferase [Acidobacteriota bacterium]